MAHEGPELCVGNAVHAGLRFEHIRDLDEGGMMRLSKRDRRKGIGLLKRGLLGGELMAEVQRMLVLNVRAEMQILDKEQGGIGALLEELIHV